MAALSRASITAPLIHEYLIEEDEMGDSAAQTFLLQYLGAVLEWLYRAAGWYVARDLTFYHPAIRNSQQMISPDIAVFLGIPLSADERRRLTSWDMRPSRRRNGPAGAVKPCPPVLFEVSSGSTWSTDIGRGEKHKPLLYGAMGAREYFAYDPNEPPVWRPRSTRRLLGWRYDEAGRPSALAPDERGWLWSVELASWLAPADALLQLYDAQGRRRLTGEEAKETALQEAEARAERERRAREEAEAARRRAEERLAALEEAVRARQGAPPDPSY
jgi:Uma2 family endonuclease